jgi:radical SAM protein with 4Fe4S-binding SPASM domain
VVTGRALAGDDLTAEEYEEVFEKIYNIAATAPFDVKTTEGMHYRRFVAMRERRRPVAADESQNTHRVMYRTAGVSDGKGFVFVSHRGDIFPSGFLPLKAGNILTESLVDVYRDSKLFRVLRDADQREGKCGECDYRKLCGWIASTGVCADGQLSGRGSALRAPACGGAGKEYCVGSHELSSGGRVVSRPQG